MPPRRISRRPVGLFLLRAAGPSLALFLILPSGGYSASAAQPFFPSSPTFRLFYTPPPPPAKLPIKHLILVVQENHGFDNYFGAYCQTLGLYCSTTANGIPSGVCVPLNVSNASLGCASPFLLNGTAAVKTDLPHGWNSSRTAYDNGAMDGFLTSTPNITTPMGYFDGASIPGYWDYAEQYGLGDNFFSSVFAGSLMNHWYILAGNSPAILINQTMIGRAPLAVREQYENQSNATPAIDDLLVNSNASWKYYDKRFVVNYTVAFKRGIVYSLWDPLLAKAETYNASFSPHWANRSDLFNDTLSGTLPNVSWVIPTIPQSDHPPNDIALGQTWVEQIISSIQSSPEWNSTAVFVTWDDYGGFYDHVSPPQVDPLGLSFRVPFLVVSPYSRVNYVNHHFEYFESFLKLIEYSNNFTNLNLRDGNAPLPLDFFDFNATPRPPLPTTTNLSTYPISFQTLAPPLPPANFTIHPIATGVNISWTEPVGGAPITGYNFTFGPNGPSGFQKLQVDGSADGLRIQNLFPGAVYSFRISSYAGATSSFVLNITFRTPFPPGTAFPDFEPMAGVYVSVVRPRSTHDLLAAG